MQRLKRGENMAFIGWPELILILAIVLLLFGATRIKGLAKAVGESVQEFKKATSESPKTRKEEENAAIIDAAKKMGIETEGKSVEQILGEMNQKAASKREMVR
jgi:sec-independent protein translocase protein TatA